jgi:hypothetical protein
MGYPFSPSPRVPTRFGFALIIGVATFSVGLAGGFISGIHSERMERERIAQRSKFAVERANLQQRELERRINDLESQLSANREDVEKWRTMKNADAVLNTRK